ncbi:MAG TPA: hypothetical protein VHS28_09190, partial [Chloroflexota bacterium]|nr:hypothetical protein [Chloroflexota bacterium]
QVRGENEVVDVHDSTHYRKLVSRSGVLVGAVLVGDLREAGRLMGQATSQTATAPERQPSTNVAGRR